MLSNTSDKITRKPISEPVTWLDSNDNPLTHVVFHFPCKDGFGAAWAYHKHRLSSGIGKVMYHPTNHNGTTVQDLLLRPSISQERVIFLDICPKRDILIQIHDKALDCVVWDHHKTAKEECGDLPYVHVIDNKSGAGIAWDEFVGTKRPFLIDCIEDGDLWRWNIPDSDKVLIVLESIKFDFDLWSDFSEKLEDPNSRNKIIEKGRAYAEYRSQVVHRLCSRNKIHKITVGPNNLEIPAVNAGIFQSGIGNILATKLKPGAAAIWYTNGRRTFYSLRSTDKGPDVEAIAKYHGGGGHRNAAAFVIEQGASPIKMTDYTDSAEDILEMLLLDNVNYLIDNTFGAFEDANLHNFELSTFIDYALN